MPPEPYYAHSGDKPRDEWDLLLSHLQRTAEVAAEFGRAYTGRAARIAGLWHDAGKYQRLFQKYLRGEVPRGPQHAIVGARCSSAGGRALMPIALAIAGHHGELRQWDVIENELIGSIPICQKEWSECSRVPEIQPLLSAGNSLVLPPKREAALFTRFLYSALVDADSLLTEEWDLGQPRTPCILTLSDLLPKLEAHLRTLNAGGKMNALRQAVQSACRSRAADPPGTFRLTVPTGGGKTLAALLFALQHGVLRSKARVFTVIPYTSIIDQTAKVYRDIFGPDPVLEHHSNIDPDRDEPIDRRRVENWDSPLIVTTSVRFFETLFANRKRLLRRLHRVADSVVILDEIQTFPLHLRPALEFMLNRLVRDFGVTVLHCSATQPLLLQRDATEIAPDPPSMFSATRSRVRVTFPGDWDTPVAWPDLAQQIRERPERQVLTIVHTRKDAIDLATLVGSHCIHLSTWMCPFHRRHVIADIKDRLKRGGQCLVVSTQLVEAGVDIDFPVVYRAFGGLDSLVQSAGRCNREGDPGRTGDFNAFLAPSKPPTGILAKGFSVARQMVRNGQLTAEAMDAPDTVALYFSELGKLEEGVRGSQFITEERRCNFPEVAKLKMIDDHDEVTVIAPYCDWLDAVKRARSARNAESVRALQQYSVSLFRGVFHSLASHFEPLWPDSKVWAPFASSAASVYDSRFGFGSQGPMDLLSF